MFDRLRHRIRKRRDRNELHHATADLSPYILRDIGLSDARRELTRMHFQNFLGRR